jgi:SAM-dependent methyltransferase
MTVEARWLGSMPEIYDRCLAPALFAPYADYLAQRATEWSPQRVLETAAGSGVVTRALVDALPDAEIVATDLNPAMVEWGGARVPEAVWKASDAQRLDEPDSAFDLVVCQFGVMFFPDRPAAFAEAARVLAPDGRYLFTVWDSAETSHFPAALVTAMQTVLGSPGRFVTDVPHGYGAPDRIRADSAAGGLAVEDLDRVVLQGHAPSARVVAEGYCLGTPVRFELEQHGDPEQLAGAIGDEMTRVLGDGPVTSDLPAYVVVARHGR